MILVGLLRSGSLRSPPLRSPTQKCQRCLENKCQRSVENAHTAALPLIQFGEFNVEQLFGLRLNFCQLQLAFIKP